MKTKKFSIKEALQVGWEATKKDFKFFVGLLLIVWLIILLAALLEQPANVIVIIIAALVIILGLTRISLRHYDKKPVQISDIFRTHNVFFRFLLGALLYHLIVIVGLVLLIVPGIIWSIQFKFYIYFIVDKGAGPIEALKMSSRITKGAKWDLFWFNVTLVGILILGLAAFVVGLFVAIPLIMVSTAHVYRKLLKSRTH